MRFRSFVLWIVLLAMIGWAGYTIVVAGSRYVEASGMVDVAVVDALHRRKAQIGAGMSQEAIRDLGSNVRVGIRNGAKARNIPIEPESLSVLESGDSLRVSVTWHFPVNLYDGYTLFNVPMSVTRSYATN